MTIEEFKKNIAPYMNKGYVAMNKRGDYWWYAKKPYLSVLNNRCWANTCDVSSLNGIFNIEPAEDWTKSLIEVGK